MGPFDFLVCSSSNAFAQSPIGATDMHFLPEASSRSLLHVCEQQRLRRDCAYAQACPSLCWSPMWKVPFSYVPAHLFTFRIKWKKKILMKILSMSQSEYAFGFLTVSMSNSNIRLFFVFPENMTWHVMYHISLGENLQKKCQVLKFLKNKKVKLIWASLEKKKMTLWQCDQHKVRPVWASVQSTQGLHRFQT